MIYPITDLNFKEHVLKASIPVLVNFGAPWCGLCKLIQPTLINFQDRWDGQVKLITVNADDNLKLASTYRLRTLPTLILFANGRIVDRLESFDGHGDLRANLDRMMKTAAVDLQVVSRSAPMQIDWQLVSG